MSLLVLKLEVPEVMHHSSNEMMLQQLVALGPQFAPYVVTFLIAGGFWFLHHLTFHFVRQGHLLIHPVSQLFYFGNQLAIAALLNAHWLYARGRGLLESADLRQISRLTLRIGVTAAAFVACLTTAIFLPTLSWVPLPVFLAGGMIAESRK